jgi:dihydroorotase
VRLAELTGCRYHVQHVSTAGAVELVRAARAAGVAVTAEVTPHHLSFDDTAVVGGDPDYKMKPPLRSAPDVVAVRAALRDGILDLVGTDHAPHSRREKDAGFEAAPFGVLGLETAAAAVNTAVSLEPGAFFERMSMAPARLAGLQGHGQPLTVGAEANLVVFDPDLTWIPTRLMSKSDNCPFLGRSLRGRVALTVFQGRITHRAETP